MVQAHPDCQPAQTRKISPPLGLILGDFATNKNPPGDIGVYRVPIRLNVLQADFWPGIISDFSLVRARQFRSPPALVK